MSGKKTELEELREAVGAASGLLKALANEDRLLILCHLAQGEKNVSELQDLLDVRQPTLSQQLARLRFDRLVETRRDGKAIFYSLASTEAGRVIELLHGMYCQPSTESATKRIKSKRTAAG